MKEVMLKNLKRGEWFTRKPIEEPTDKQVFIKGDYDRSTKRYTCTRFSDICSFITLKPTAIVYTDFTF